MIPDLLAAMLVAIAVFGVVEAWLSFDDSHSLWHALGFLVLSLWIFYLTVR